jgi:hypothetical protein
MLYDRQVYYEPAPGQRWELLDQPPANFAIGEIKLAYVFRETFKKGHKGVVVVKTGRVRGPFEAQPASTEKKVALVRQKGNYCRGTRSFRGRVSALSYDEYHDLGKGSDGVNAIEQFHAGYIGRKGYCRQTNEGVADPDGMRTNRAQFSYDANVVSAGAYSQLANAFGVTAALASSEKYEDQRVEIKQYETQPGLATCVRITLAPQKKPAAFVRINDLEGLTFDLTGYVRSSETEWKLTP